MEHLPNKTKKSRKNNSRNLQQRQTPNQDFQIRQINKRRRREHNIKIVFSAICLIVLVLTSYGVWQYYDTQKPPVIGGAAASGTSFSDVSAPDFSLQDINGTQVSLSQYKGKVIGIHFMAVGCHGDIYPINGYQLTQLSNVFNEVSEDFALLTVAMATCENSELDEIRSDYNVKWILGNDYSDKTLEIINSYVPFEIGDGAVVLVDIDFKIAEIYNGGVSADELVTKINQLGA